LWKGTVVRGGGVSHDGVDVAEEGHAEDHVADFGGGVGEDGVSGLDDADAERGLGVFWRFCGKVEGVDGDFGAVVDGEGEVEGGGAGDVVCW